MNIVILGGTGFIGINIAQRFLRDGHAVSVFDRSPMPEGAIKALEALPGTLRVMQGDVTNASDIEKAIAPGTDIVILGAAITAGSKREAADPETILRVNLLSHVTALQRAKAIGVHRVINLSSAAAYGAQKIPVLALEEDGASDPNGLYAITKLASEKVGSRLASLWAMDFVSLRLSGVFGPWERATGLRDTLSPQYQVMSLAAKGQTAILERPGIRDWISASDVADAAFTVATAAQLNHRLYNISTGRRFTVHDWGKALEQLRPGFQCRVANQGDTPNVDLHASVDRAPLSVKRLETDTQWQASVDMAASVRELDTWWRLYGPGDATGASS